MTKDTEISYLSDKIPGYTKEQKKDFRKIYKLFKKELANEHIEITDAFGCDGYLIEGDYYRIEFSIKGLEWFRFGLWFAEESDFEICEDDADLYYRVYIFSQPTNYIDKFKPFASRLVIEESIYKPDLKKNSLKYETIKFARFVKEIKKHPYIAWYKHSKCGWFEFEYLSPIKCFLEYQKVEYLRKRNERLQTKLTKEERKWIERKLKEYNFDYKIVKHENCFPEYDVIVKDTTVKKKEFCAWLTEEEEKEFRDILEKYKRKYKKAYFSDAFGLEVLRVKEYGNALRKEEDGQQN